MHLPCKQTQAGALPAASTNCNRGEDEIQASLISSASAGATPPRYQFQGNDPAA